jgi:Outer membrane protein LpxR
MRRLPLPPLLFLPIAVGLLVLGPAIARAADAARSGRWTLAFENDTMSHPSSDRDYTMGFFLSRSYAGDDGPKVLWALSGGGVEASWWTLANQIFTPKGITLSDVIPGDRPYADLWSLAGGYSRAVDSVTWTEIEVQLGLLGTSTGDAAQTLAHEWVPSHGLPEGWRHQIGDGGSATFLWHAGLNRILLGVPERPYRLTGGAGVEAGYYVRGFAHLTLHLGVPRDGDAAWRPDSPTLDLNRFGAAPAPGDGAPVWIAYGVSAWSYNELLQGAWSGDNDLTYGRGAMETWVQEASIGVDLTPLLHPIPFLRWAHLHYAEHFSSQQLNTTGGRSEYWGAVFLSWAG